MLAYVKNATVKDLNIYGEEINGYGLVDGLHGVGFTSEDTFAIIIENVTLKSGTKTLKSGLIGAEASLVPVTMLWDSAQSANAALTAR